MLVLDEVQQLRDDALIERLRLSVRNDRRLAVRMLVELGEVQERGLYRDLGYSSLFEFATKKLGMSEAEAGLRIRAAKVGRSFGDLRRSLGVPFRVHSLHARDVLNRQTLLCTGASRDRRARALFLRPAATRLRQR